jgi:basic membrane protein A
VRRRPRLVPLLLPLALLVVACGGGDDDGQEREEPSSREIGVVYDVATPGGEGINEAALLAVANAEDELEVTIESFETDATGSDREDLLRLFAEQGFGLVIGVGAAFRPAVEAAAPDYDEVTFVVVDDYGPDLPGVVSISFAEQQAAYLAGAAAALSSTTHRVGFIGGQDDERTRRSQAGFHAGAIRADPAVAVDVAYVPPGTVPGIDPVKVREVVLAQFGAGADVVYGVPGAVSDPLFAAAIEHGPGARAIGADTDRSETAPVAVRGAILASVVKDIEAVLREVITAFADSGLEPGTLTFDLADEAMALSTAGALAPEVRERITELTGLIVGGQIQVPTAP